MGETKVKLSKVSQAMIDKIRRIAEDRERARKEAFEKKAEKCRMLLKRIRGYGPEMSEVSAVAKELFRNELISSESDLICSPERGNIACSARGWRCFGGYNILPELNWEDKSIGLDETSLFYDFVDERFCICRPYAENSCAKCTDEWLIEKCIEYNAIAKALNDIAVGFKAYEKKVLKFVDNLK